MIISYFSIRYFEIFGLKIYTWGFFLSLAFLVGLILAYRVGKKINIQADKILNLVVIIFISAILGARLFYLLQWPADFIMNPSSFFQISGGFMFLGGLAGGSLAGFIYLRKFANKWLLIDNMTPIIPLSMAIGRVGCFLTNDHQGALTHLPFGILWPDGALRQPVALYLILFDLALFGFLLWYQKRESRPGQIFLMFLIFYSAVRFLLDFLRDSASDPHLWFLSISQWLSILLLVFLGGFLLTKSIIGRIN